MFTSISYLRCLSLFAIVLLGVLHAGGIASATSDSRAKTQRFKGVTAKFDLLNREIKANESLKIRLTLWNSSDQQVSFSYTSAFILHVRVYNESKKEVHHRSNAPILEPVAIDVSLRPTQKFSTVVAVDLKTFYNLASGKYYIRFYYDLRLLDDDQLITHYRKLNHGLDFVLWDTRFYPIQVKK